VDTNVGLMMKPASEGAPQYPIGTIAAYGPNNTLATKLVVAVFKKRGRKDPDELHRWITHAGDVRQDPVIAAEVAGFLKRNGVKNTVTGDRIMGCPHEEEIDYPAGGTCPHCPFWANVDRFTHEPKSGASSPLTERRAGPKVGRNDPCPCGSGKKYKHCCGAQQ
jgi:hypothetical protein